MSKSYLIRVDPKSRKAGRFVAKTHMRIQRAFEQSGLRQQDLARKLGVNRSIVNRQLKGEANLTLRTIAELAWAMNTNVDIVFSSEQMSRGQNSYYFAGSSADGCEEPSISSEKVNYNQVNLEASDA